MAILSELIAAEVAAGDAVLDALVAFSELDSDRRSAELRRARAVLAALSWRLSPVQAEFWAAAIGLFEALAVFSPGKGNLVAKRLRDLEKPDQDRL